MEKTIILFLPCDQYGCSHYRFRYAAHYLNAHPEFNTEAVISGRPILADEYLEVVKSVVIQKPCGPEALELVKCYAEKRKERGFKLIYEADDLLFKTISDKSDLPQSTPTYNMSYSANPADYLLDEILPLFDRIVVSTEYLANCYRERFGLKNVIVQENYLTDYLWANNVDYRTEEIEVPQFLYTGGGSHYSNSEVGDWNLEIREWLIAALKAGRVKLTVVGGLPHFFSDVSNLIRVIPWTDCMSYPTLCKNIRPDFLVNPLLDNEFNRCKSDIHYLEACATGCVFLWNEFDSRKSPYENCPNEACYRNSPRDIDEVVSNLCKPEVYNKVLDMQIKCVQDRILSSNISNWISSYS